MNYFYWVDRVCQLFYDCCWWVNIDYFKYFTHAYVQLFTLNATTYVRDVLGWLFGPLCLVCYVLYVMFGMLCFVWSGLSCNLCLLVYQSWTIKILMFQCWYIMCVKYLTRRQVLVLLLLLSQFKSNGSVLFIHRWSF